MAFQQHHLGVLMAKQLGKFNFLMELELQNVPHHPEVATGEEHEEGEEPGESDISGEGQVAVENAWMEYNYNRLLSVRGGKQLSPQYWWQNHYPNLTLSTALPIYLRELFPAELVGVTVQGSAARPVGTSEFGIGYKVYVANNNFEGNSRTDRRDGKSWGARGEVRFPTAGALRRLDVAADIYRGHVGLSDKTLAEDHVIGFETQLELGRAPSDGVGRAESRWGRHAQGITCSRRFGSTKTGSRSTAWSSSKARNPAGRAAALGRRELQAISQIAFKGELYRSLPLERDFIHTKEMRKASRSTGSRWRRCFSSDSRDAQTADGGVDCSHVDQACCHRDHRVCRHRKQSEPGEVAHPGRAAPHLHEAVPDVAARRADGSRRLGEHALSAFGILEGRHEPVCARNAGLLVQQSITQGLTPPSTQRSARAVTRFVGSVPGAISYIPPSEVDETVNVVAIK